MDWYKAKEYAPSVVRIGIALVFLWFSINQFLFVNKFVGLIPEFAVNATGYSPAVFVMINAFFEFIFGTLLLLGVYTRLSAFLLSIHLLSISYSLGYGTTMIRDLGLTIATFSVFLQGRDKLCLEKEK